MIMTSTFSTFDNVYSTFVYYSILAIMSLNDSGTKRKIN